MMGVDKQKARRQRSVHLTVDCEEAADMSRDLFYVNRLLSFVRTKTEKDNGY
jgi:hypothetical protein